MNTVASSAEATPNPSVEARPNGGPPGPPQRCCLSSARRAWRPAVGPASPRTLGCARSHPCTRNPQGSTTGDLIHVCNAIHGRGTRDPDDSPHSASGATCLQMRHKRVRNVSKQPLSIHSAESSADAGATQQRATEEATADRRIHSPAEFAESGSSCHDPQSRGRCAGAPLHMRRPHTLQSYDFLRRSQVLPGKLPQRQDGRQPRRHSLRAAVVQVSRDISTLSPAQPNPSLKRSANGMPPGPVWRYTIHFRQPGPGVLPSSPA